MKRAQASFETLAVFALLFVVLIPILFVFYSYSVGTAERMRVTQLTVIGSDIMAAAETVYYLGEPTRLTLVESFPSGITGMTVSTGGELSELVFELNSGGDAAFFAEVPVQGDFEEWHWTQGEKLILLQAESDYVTIQIT